MYPGTNYKDDTTPTHGFSRVDVASQLKLVVGSLVTSVVKSLAELPAGMVGDRNKTSEAHRSAGEFRSASSRDA